MKVRLIFPSVLLMLVLVLGLKTNTSPFKYMAFEGFITEEMHSVRKFYLQNLEAGDVIELKFIDENLDMLSFSEFGIVIVKGNYNSKEGYLIVNEIEGIDNTKEDQGDWALIH